MNRLLFIALLLLAIAGCGKTADEYVMEARQEPNLDKRLALLDKAISKDPASREALLARAALNMADKKYDPAIADYDSLMKTTKDASEAANIMMWRGLALDGANRLDDAIASYTAAIRLDTRFVTPYAARAWAQLRSERYPDAMEDYLVVLASSKAASTSAQREQIAEWRLQRGVAAFCAGEWSSAAGDFKAAQSSKNPAISMRAIVNLYFVACKIGSKSDADKSLQAFVEQLQVENRQSRQSDVPLFIAGKIDEKAFTEAYKTEPKAAMLYYIGEKLLRGGARDKARSVFEKAVAPPAPAVLEYHLALSELRRLEGGGKSASDLAATAAKARTPEEKIILYTEALRIDPQMTDARFSRAIIYSLAGKYDDAIADFTMLLETYKRPSNLAATHRYRGWAYSRKGDSAAAVRDFEAALNIEPTFWEARENLANAYASLHQYKKAAAEYTNLLSPEVGGGDKANWLVNRGFSCAGMRDWAAAATDFKAAVDNKPDDAIARVNLLISKRRAGLASDDIRPFAERLRETTWDNAVAWFFAGMINEAKFLKLSEHSDASIQATRTSRAWYYVGVLRSMKGDAATAHEAFQKTVQIGNKGAETWELRLALEELSRPGAKK